jgi:glycosyltransferase 2 family protein
VLARTDPRWGLVGLSAIVVLATYMLLVEGWRRLLAALGGTLGHADAARVWFVSNLARYMPGWFWTLGAMTELARRRGVPVTVSTSSAVVINIVNVFTGLVVATAFAASTPAILDSDRARLLLLAGAVVLLAMPVFAPRLVGLARRLTGRELAIPRVGMRAVAVAALSTALAWLAYGVAFWVLAATRGDTVLTEVPLSDGEKAELRANGVHWLDLAGRSRSAEGSPLTEELATFIARYGIRLPRDG